MAHSSGSPASVAPAGVRRAASPGSSHRLGKALSALRAEDRAVTRGAAESHVYQAAAPSVVLIVAGDSLGSGAIVSADGKVVTNLHVVGKEKTVMVVFKPKVEGAEPSDADVRRGKVIRRDEVADLALLQVEDPPKDIKALAVGAAGAIEVGSDVHAIGHPTGEAWTYTRGIVSQIRENYSWATKEEHGLQHTATVIQTQTPINPGNSGGPLLDDKLEIVGINSFISDGEGLNFAVSAADVTAFLARTSDRTVPRGKKAGVKAAAMEDTEDTEDKACKMTVLDEHKVKDPKGKMYLVDMDCDGKGDVMVQEPDNKKLGLTYFFDDDDNGEVDTVYFDDDRDGNFDQALFDTDGNGKADMQGEFKPGESEPYRWERIEEK